MNRPRFFYRDEYVYDALEAGFRHAFDVEKPRRIRDALLAGGFAEPADFAAPPAVTEEELRLVHPPSYLEEIRRPERLAKLLLLDPEHPWDERLLEPFLYATGGTIAAVREAVLRRRIGANLGGGFHHAQADRADGFCPIADVAIAIRVLRRKGLGERVLIVDLDHHHGNGNAEIFSDDESVFTFSIHDNAWCRIDKRHNLDVELPSGAGDTVYLAALRESLPPVVHRFGPDLLIYLAGSDPFAGDALGDLGVSEEGLLERDRFVTRAALDADIPMAIVTAGGYGPESWRIHFNYFRWLVEHDD